VYRTNEADETLVMLTLAGEQGAYEALVTRHQRAAVASALAVTKTRFLAEDAAQDAFVTAWMKLDTLRVPAKFGPWVCRIARNCARSMLDRYRGFLPLEAAENLAACGAAGDPAAMAEKAEERKELRESLKHLPERVREIIRLHYAQDLSVAEIAERLRLAEGTVKWQLHEGRKRMRKELCALNEKYGDTLVQRVMKKVEELKLWQLQNDKSGFEKVYRNVLREVEELPECREKQHALADVLMMGWWWLPGKKNDALFARIADAALDGHNEEVMAFIVTREDYQAPYDIRAEFIRDKQIPRLEKAGFTGTAGREWFWCGYYFYRNGKPEEGAAAYDRAESLLPPDDPFHALVPCAREMEAQLASRYQDTPKERFVIGCCAQEYRVIDGELRYRSEEGFRKEAFDDGYLCSVDRNSWKVLRNASFCDGRFFAPLAPGGSITGSDGTKLTFLSDGETASTPAGTFDGCQLWETKRLTEAGKTVCRSWYKDGVGIVRQDHSEDGVNTTVLLREVEIRGGSGLLPIHTGNRWKYALDCPPETVFSEITATVSYASGQRAIIASWENLERRRYDEDSWADAVQEISQEYYRIEENGAEVLQDITPAIQRARHLAVTPMEKAHAKAAAAVAERILSADPVFHPAHTATGHWDFFQRSGIIRKNGTLQLTEYNPRWSFEWKNTDPAIEAETPLYYNDILGILQDAANAIWSDEWRPGASPVVEYMRFSRDIRTQITCEEGGTVVTGAGTFDNCRKLTLDIDGMEDGLAYRGGKKVYWFAEGIGIVRTESEYCAGARTAVYELTAFEGTGEGYMPAADGLVRRYEAQGLTDGYVGAAEYTYAADEDGDVVVFADRTGIRRLPPPITFYGAIQGEITEERLWNEGRREESRLRHDINNFRLLCHFLVRPSRYWGAPAKAVVVNKYRMKIMEGLGEGGQVPEAWLGFYGTTILRLACALFGCGKTGEGYDWLEKAFAVFSLWDGIPDGKETEVGDPMVYGDIRLIKGRSLLRLPDGTTEPVSAYGEVFRGTGGILYYSMTAPRGWEWFDPVRKEDRFLEYVERAKKMTEA
jgi:RNA polymerase sigma-70 factor (ECF subfamily)